MPEIACVGVGTVGRSWAIVFARAGYDVALWDAAPEATARAMPLIAQALADPAVADSVDRGGRPIGRVRAADTLEDALGDAIHVQESAIEQIEIKRPLFARIDALLAPEALIASSTSAIPASLLFEEVAGRHRCLVAHPVNPPHLIPLVEISGASFTADESVEAARALMERVGQAPVVLRREIPGFLLNRLQWALVSEAMHLVGEGYCSPEDADRVLTSGLALRWALIGPFEVAHLNAAAGVQGYYDGLSEAIGRVQDSLRTDYRPSPETVAHVHARLAERIPTDTIPERQQARDARILALRRHLATGEA